jgi:hypothetical protein
MSQLVTVEESINAGLFSLMAKDVLGKLSETGHYSRQDVSNNVRLPSQRPTRWLRPLIIV